MPQAGSFSRPNERYTDRAHAGQVLASKITALQLADPVVLGLARGGVPVAAQVARALRAPLQVCVARKIGAPGQPELALGAVTADGPPTYDDALVLTDLLVEALELLADKVGMTVGTSSIEDDARWSSWRLTLVD